MKKNINYYMNLPYTIQIIPYGDGSYFAKIVELPGCMTEGDNWKEIGEMIEDAKRGWLEVSLEKGIKIPLPKNN